MNDLSPRVYKEILRLDLGYFAQHCFCELNPQAAFLPNWHIEVIAAKLAAVRAGKIRRLIINLPPRHLKSLLASIAFPAWCLGHDPSTQILCVSYAQDLADKLARDCRGIMMSPWYRQIFRTRLAPHRQAVQEFITTRQGYRLATSTGGVLTGRGADLILIDDPLKPEGARSPPSSTSAGRSASTISLVSISNPRHPWAAGWSRKHGSSATASTSGPSASSASCRAGTPPTRRPSSATSASARPGVSAARTFTYSACCVSGSNIRHSNARCASSRTCSTPPRC